MLYGTLLLELYDFQRALEEFSVALQIARDDGDTTREGRVLNNLAGLYSDAGECEKALKIFERIANGWQRIGDIVSAKTAFANAALAALRLGDIDKALSLAQSWVRLGPFPENTPQSRLWTAQGGHTVCMTLIEAGRVDEALRLTRGLSVGSFPALTAQAETFFEIDSAVTTYLTGAADQGVIFAAIERARGESPNQYWTSLDSAVRAFERAGEVDLALMVQRRLLEFNKDHKFALVKTALGRTLEEGTASSKLVKLNASIDRSISLLVALAVSQSIRAGYDRTRVFRVSRLSKLFAAALSWAEDDSTQVALAAKLIDIGNLVVPDEILGRHRELTLGERRLLDEHAAVGSNLLSSARLHLLQTCVPAVRFHHERWDGLGTMGLEKEAIPAEARLISICDAFDALTHERPWRRALSPQRALEILLSERGTRFDPGMIESFGPWLTAIVKGTGDLDAFLSEEAHENSAINAMQRIERLVGVS